MWKRRYALMNEAGDGTEGSAAGSNESADTASPSTEEDVNWGEIADEMISEDQSTEGDLEVVETPEEPNGGSAVPPAVETPPEPTPPTPTPTPVEPPAPATAPTPTPVAEASEEQYSEWRANRLTQLEQTYALNEADATAMLTEPELVLPKLAAQVHMQVLENSMRAMQAMVPVMMRQVQQNTEVEGRAKNLFTSINPDLADPNLEPTILELGSVYRKVNKTAPPEEAARAIGNLVRAALGIAAPAGGGSAAVPPTPTVQAVAPFTPARGAGGGNSPVQPSNPYELMALEMLNDGD